AASTVMGAKPGGKTCPPLGSVNRVLDLGLVPLLAAHGVWQATHRPDVLPSIYLGPLMVRKAWHNRSMFHRRRRANSGLDEPVWPDCQSATKRPSLCASQWP